MRIRTHRLKFAPEQTAIGESSGDMAASLGAEDYEIRMVAGRPYHPGWTLDPVCHGQPHRKEHSLDAGKAH